MTRRIVVTSITVTPTLAWMDDDNNITPVGQVGAITCGLGQLSDVAAQIKADIPRIESEIVAQERSDENSATP